MNILLTGAGGFIGQAVLKALQAAGHTVHQAVSPRRAAAMPGSIATDFARDTAPSVWLPRLQGIDAVVNAVGVLRDSRSRPIAAVHRDTPVALFDACAQAGVRRVVQVSALGIVDNATQYASTKRAADEHLLALHARGLLQATVVRPSIVFGRGGASSALFMQLARLPLIALPRPVLQARVQPLVVADLALAITRMLEGDAAAQGVVECTGPQAMPLADFIASLRMQCGYPPARVLTLPDWLTQLSARAGDLVPAAPWCSETLALLQQHNVGDAQVLRTLIQREPVHPDQMVSAAWSRA
ncbi:MAG: NAD-dependent epimerase/dehydratase family protein [Comamonadaceae bacterium]|nr:MAG: NAD-dependent epimerase/dehydratase family protein [Comamonadaceae bacterium]